MVWGMGMALIESMAFDARNGHLVNRDLGEYHIPVNLEEPKIDVVLIEDRDDWVNPNQVSSSVR